MDCTKRRWITFLSLLLLFGCAVTPAWSQSSGSTFVALPRAFAGVGVGFSSKDADSRMRLGSDVSPVVWLIEGGVSFSSRVGLGVEFVRVGDATGSTSGNGWTSSGTQQERHLIGLMRGRLFGGTHLALDVVGGVGVLMQHHERLEALCYVGVCNPRSDTLDENSRAFAFGADVTLGGNRHFSVVTLARYYVLERGDHKSTAPLFDVPWQYEWSSSTRFTFAVTARVGW